MLLSELIICKKSGWRLRRGNNMSRPPNGGPITRNDGSLVQDFWLGQIWRWRLSSHGLCRTNKDIQMSQTHFIKVPLSVSAFKRDFSKRKDSHAKKRAQRSYSLRLPVHSAPKNFPIGRKIWLETVFTWDNLIFFLCSHETFNGWTEHLNAENFVWRLCSHGTIQYFYSVHTELLTAEQNN